MRSYNAAGMDLASLIGGWLVGGVAWKLVSVFRLRWFTRLIVCDTMFRRIVH